jgi:hypothetical protein
MSTLIKELHRYLAIRRSLGYDLSTSARVLRRFVAFAHSQGARYITTDLFLAWQAEFGQANQHTWSARAEVKTNHRRKLFADKFSREQIETAHCLACQRCEHSRA